MSKQAAGDERPARYKGVTTLPRPRGGRAYLARIRRAKGVDCHLGIYETPGAAAFAFNVASEAIGRGSMPPNEIPRGDQPDADAVRRIGDRVRRRLGLEPRGRARGRVADALPPDPDDLLTLFEVAIVGFWRREAAEGDAAGLDVVAKRLAASARLVFWNPGAGHPDPSAALARLLGRRLDEAFRRSDLARLLLDDDEDDDWRVARWLVLPDVFPAGRGFRDEVRHLYPDAFAGEAAPAAGVPHWSTVLGVAPPFGLDALRDAYRARSKAAHPDAGGSHAEFVRLRAAYEEGREYCRVRGL